MADVLIVDDDPAVRRLLALILRERGHQVREAATAEEALVRSAESRADLMVLDLSLPGLDGSEFLAWLDRGLGRPRSLCIVTGHPEASVREIAARSGATYVIKPFSPEEFEAAVDVALRSLEGDLQLR